jgi:hypothetical protein
MKTPFYVFVTAKFDEPKKPIYVLSTQYENAAMLSGKLDLVKPKLDSPEAGIEISDFLYDYLMKQTVNLDTDKIPLPRTDLEGGIVRYKGDDGYKQTKLAYITPDVVQALQSPTSRRYHGIQQKPSDHGKRCVFSRG